MFVATGGICYSCGGVGCTLEDTCDGVVYGQAGTVVGLVEEDISERPSCVCAVYYPVRKRAMKKTFETYDIVKSDL